MANANQSVNARRTPISEISTSEVRESYQSSGDGLDFKRRFNERGEEFDRWLESAKREAAAVALEEAAQAIDERAKAYSATALRLIAEGSHGESSRYSNYASGLTMSAAATRTLATTTRTPGEETT